MRSLVWFRSDLRADDNPALHAALERADEGVVGLFLVSGRQWKSHGWGAPKIGFVKQSVEALEVELDRLGVPLVTLDAGDFRAAPGLLAGLVEEVGVDSVFANREYEVNERARDRAVESRLAEEACPIAWYEEQTVLPPDRLRTGAGGFYSVYTPFWRSWSRELEERELPLPVAPPGPARRRVALSRGQLRGAADPWKSTVTRAEATALEEAFPAGEQEAARRLQEFARTRIEAYVERRDIAAEEGTSRLSPYLAVGSLSIRRCLEAALAANQGRLSGGHKGVDTWIKELAWREFYRHVMVGFPRVSKDRAFREETEAVSWRDDPVGFAAWCAGRTGIPLVDAGMRQLEATGWMHNRLRMVTAMFLTKNLLIDWRLGERYFCDRLIDVDLASNNGGWQWSASTGTDAAPYFRIFNPWRQAERYDSEARFVKRWVPELSELPAAVVNSPKRLATVRDSVGYPEPIVDLSASRARAIAAFAELKKAT